MSHRRVDSICSRIRFIAVATCVLGGHALAHAQSSLSVASQRPFVIGVVPVVGNGGAVGGVAIDAKGAIRQAEERNLLALRTARQAALEGVAGDVNQPSQLRKISLRRLDALMAKHASQNKPLPAEVLYLAGLQRIEYVFAYPELNDVVLAGPAEGWTIDDAGNAVGVNSAAAVLQLVDLVAALRTTDRLLAGEIISCSIDPTPAGLQRFTRVMRARPTSPSSNLLRRMEQAVGPQTIKLTGVAPDSHFAHVLVAADWQMKRLAMGVASPPSKGGARGGIRLAEHRSPQVNGLSNLPLPSYLDLLKDNPRVTPRNALPRWWIAFGREPVERDPEGLGWRLSPPGVEVRTAAADFDTDGQIVDADIASDPIAVQWADAMTVHYDKLAIAEPVFGQLRSCMDLALVTAVLASGDLLTHVGLELPMLLDATRLELAPHPVPKTVASHASALRRSRAWIVTVSGGVELDVTRAVNDAAVQPEIGAERAHAIPQDAASWWWD